MTERTKRQKVKIGNLPEQAQDLSGKEQHSIRGGKVESGSEGIRRVQSSTNNAPLPTSGSATEGMMNNE